MCFTLPCYVNCVPYYYVNCIWISHICVSYTSEALWMFATIFIPFILCFASALSIALLYINECIETSFGTKVTGIYV